MRASDLPPPNPAGGITLDLNGHTVTYNTGTGDRVYGVLITWNKANIRITNGTFRQGAGEYKNNRNLFPAFYAADNWHAMPRLTLPGI